MSQTDIEKATDVLQRYEELGYPYSPTMDAVLAAFKKIGYKPAKGTPEELQWLNEVLPESWLYPTKPIIEPTSAKPTPAWGIGKMLLVGAVLAAMYWASKREERKAAARAITEELRGV